MTILRRVLIDPALHVHESEPADPQLQRLWFATLRKPWSCLAIVPADASVALGDVPELLLAVGQEHGARQVRLVNGRGAQLADVHRVVSSLRLTSPSECVMVAVDAFADSPAAVPIVCAASAALLVVRVGESHMEAARQTVETIGRDRIIGAIVLA
jgi:hypothetical protein